MCGIAGIFNFDGLSVRQEQLSAMTDRMVERGPDDDGFYVSGYFGMGFRRLSIIDVEGGHQPLSNEDETLQLVLNGEIYNYIELRNQLVARGHVFRTNSDAEVVLHLYEEKGVDLLAELNGMFAFALFDKKRNATWIVRDRLGVKPLFYASTKDRFIFASDMRAVRAVYQVEINSKAVLKYLGLAYVPGEETIWRGIKKLHPAHYLWVEGAGSIESKQYWSVSPTGAWQGAVSEATEQLDWFLSDSTRLQMRSDVPVGIFLSGGTDSSAIVSYASQLTQESLRTFTINFQGKNSSDARFAQLVAQRYRTHHVEIQMGAAEALLAIDDLLHRMDEPISDSAIFPAYLLSRAAEQQGVKVLLNGAGGDEIFGGYSRHWPPSVGSPAWVAESIPNLLRSGVAGLWAMFQPHRGIRASNPVFAWASGVSGVNLSACKHLLRDFSAYKELNDAIVNEYADIAGPSQRYGYAYDRMAMDLKTYLPNDVLSLTDKASMAASVECRVPLLDHRLVEFAFSLPPDINLHGGKPKGLFREVLAKRLPADLLDRKKDGFNAPISEWMQQLGALNLEEELLHHRTSLLDEILNPAELVKILSNPKSRVLASETLFSLFLLNRWYRAQAI